MTVSSTAPAAEVETSARAPKHRGKPPLSEGARAERKLAFLLCAPAVIIMVAVTAYPIGYALWLSLQRYDLRFPADRAFAGLSNYVAVLSSGYWWSAFGITLLITIVSVAIEFVLGLALALVMHRTIIGRGLTRTVVLIPYGIVTVVAAFSWQFAWTPETGYLANMLPAGSAPLTDQAAAIVLIIIAEVWKTTPFMALLLLAGLALVPDDLLKAAQVDGAGPWERLTQIILPMMKPAIIYILTGGSNGTGSVSMLGYNNLFRAFNLGIGSAISVLIFISVALIAFIFIKLFGAAAPGAETEGRR
jgi:multiple sugar transport system permease protein